MMSRFKSRRRAASALLTGVLLALLGLGPSGEAATRQYWTERPRPPASATSLAPDWVAVAATARPAVVNVTADQRATPGRPGGGGSGRASGFIIAPDGYILTNNHVVDGATRVQVRLDDGRELPARVAGRDPQTDLALLKVAAASLPVIPLGDSSAVQVGEPVMAVGNPFGLEQTVTTGIVSATGRVIGEGPYDDFIQTDASINPGNSGGPLINARGEAVGVNTAIVSRSGGSVGIGFAVPVHLAKFVIPQLAEKGHVERGWLGVSAQPLTRELAASLGLSRTEGALVSQVVEGSPAAAAGVRRGDVIVEVDGRKVSRTTTLSLLVAAAPIGKDLKVSVLRDGKAVTLSARVARREQPDAMSAAPPGEPAPRARLGVAVEPVTPAMASQLGLAGASGLIVRQIQPGSPAAEAGMRPGDIIVEVNRHPVKSAGDLQRAVAATKAGAPLLLLIQREGATSYVAVKV
jgi:serine protease Do